MSEFSQRLIAWQKQHGRHHLPWQVSDPYCIWLSEIMLQQTQVATVLDYYPRFIAAFPTVQDLAAAEQDQVLQLWAGLGYYSRARNLHHAAQQIVQQFGGQFPTQRIELEKLKGVGRSTAAAIAAFAFRQPETILDGNVKRVLCRVFAKDGDPANKKFEQELWTHAETLLPDNHAEMPVYTQGLMDLGATICTRSQARCNICPMRDMCQAYAQNRVAELPRKKTAVAVKQQTLFWLIAQHENGSIWLEKRPQRGIWAGLYCVPTFATLADLNDYIGTHDGEELPTITHRLTHRLLEIIPYRVAFSGSLKHGKWVAPHDLADYGLPKPLNELLHNIK
ncbi:A/G-specific adenine glycosylase [Wielerella bovis]|uniref:A/G-specific adenine glycosylase n=1 Tax=Wielerella bovis TaxID=2917790 RepID=UPI002018AA0B|nr:A/G-specific adenine glycosylase [Wielerella bovis]ULJ70106.1 A/G-specific adenine glycosylase [Wielerella bovis]